MLPQTFTGLLPNMKVYLVDRSELTTIQHLGIHSKDLNTQESFWSVLHCISKLLKSSLYQHRNISLPTDSCSVWQSTCQKGNWLLFNKNNATWTTGRQVMLQQQLLKVAEKKKKKAKLFLRVVIFFLRNCKRNIYYCYSYRQGCWWIFSFQLFVTTQLRAIRQFTYDWQEPSAHYVDHQVLQPKHNS